MKSTPYYDQGSNTSTENFTFFIHFSINKLEKNYFVNEKKKNLSSVKL